MRNTVFDFLGRSPVASVTAHMNMGEGCSVAIWENSKDRMYYETPKNHTFSLYLKGGGGTRRLDAGGVSGFPEAICVMPEGCPSDWEIKAPFRFVHLYLSDSRLREGFVKTHDCDARCMSLSEATFVENAQFAALLLQFAHAAKTGDTLHAETALAELYGALRSKSTELRGGLPPHILRRFDDWVAANLHHTIKLDDLAELAGLSSFHFHRMFRLSRGMAPHAWILAQRVSYAKKLLRLGQPILEIAMICGFSSQSHLTRVFRHHTGKTPSEYRYLVSR